MNFDAQLGFTQIITGVLLIAVLLLTAPAAGTSPDKRSETHKSPHAREKRSTPEKPLNVYARASLIAHQGISYSVNRLGMDWQWTPFFMLSAHLDLALNEAGLFTEYYDAYRDWLRFFDVDLHLPDLYLYTAELTGLSLGKLCYEYWNTFWGPNYYKKALVFNAEAAPWIITAFTDDISEMDIVAAGAQLRLDTEKRTHFGVYTLADFDKDNIPNERNNVFFSKSGPRLFQELYFRWQMLPLFDTVIAADGNYLENRYRFSISPELIVFDNTNTIGIQAAYDLNGYRVFEPDWYYDAARFLFAETSPDAEPRLLLDLYYSLYAGNGNVKLKTALRNYSILDHTFDFYMNLKMTALFDKRFSVSVWYMKKNIRELLKFMHFDLDTTAAGFRLSFRIIHTFVVGVGYEKGFDVRDYSSMGRILLAYETGHLYVRSSFF